MFNNVLQLSETDKNAASYQSSNFLQNHSELLALCLI